MADAVLKGSPGLARITRQGREGLRTWVEFESPLPVRQAELNYTTNSGAWQKRDWKTVAADLDGKAGKASALLPKEATVYYLNLVDERGCVVSSEHEELP
jgi:hypothetical protein